LQGWHYILMFGKDLDIYGKGEDSVGIERSTGKVVIRYEVKKGVSCYG